MCILIVFFQQILRYKNSKLRLYLITLAYNGKNFYGWQIQPKVATIQAELQKALSIILQQKIVLTGAGRTDAGVHASFYVANFSVEKNIKDEQKLVRNLNGFLNIDIVIYDIFEVNSEFNSRFDAISRTYHYFIDKLKNPFSHDFSFFYHSKLSILKMNEAAEILYEYNDFSCFEKLHSDNKTSYCKIFESIWTENDSQYIFKIRADRFLRNMVRSIVGTMIDIGRGKKLLIILLKLSNQKIVQMLEPLQKLVVCFCLIFSIPKL